MTDGLMHAAPSDPITEKLDRILRILEGYDDGKTTRRAGIVERLERLEKIVASITALLLAVASTVAGAWALIAWGPVVHK